MHVKKHIIPKLPQPGQLELSQLLRACPSIELNISEGCGRFTGKDFTRFLAKSLGSTNETAYCCFAAIEFGYITQEDYSAVN